MQHLGYAIVGEHGNFAYVAKGSKRLSLEASPNVGGEYLRALEKANRLPSTFKCMFVPEGWEITSQEVNEGCSGPFGRCDQVYGMAPVLLPMN